MDVFNKTLIPLALVRYEMIIANSVNRRSIFNNYSSSPDGP